jgi:hypothetical protein
MSSRKTMKRITTKNKKKPIFDNSHLETKEETKEEPETSETKEEPETIEIKEEILMSEKLKPNDKYLCTTCNMVLLYKNYDRHTKTQTHIKKFI